MEDSTKKIKELADSLTNETINKRNELLKLEREYTEIQILRNGNSILNEVLNGIDLGQKIDDMIERVEKKYETKKETTNKPKIEFQELPRKPAYYYHFYAEIIVRILIVSSFVFLTWVIIEFLIVPFIKYEFKP